MIYFMQILSEAPCPYICRSAGAVCEGDVDVVEGEAVAKLVAYYLYRSRKPKLCMHIMSFEGSKANGRLVLLNPFHGGRGGY